MKVENNCELVRKMIRVFGLLFEFSTVFLYAVLVFISWHLVGRHCFHSHVTLVVCLISGPPSRLIHAVRPRFCTKNSSHFH